MISAMFKGAFISRGLELRMAVYLATHLYTEFTLQTTCLERVVSEGTDLPSGRERQPDLAH